MYSLLQKKAATEGQGRMGSGTWFCVPVKAPWISKAPQVFHVCTLSSLMLHDASFLAFSHLPVTLNCTT